MRFISILIAFLVAVPAEATVVLLYHRFDEPRHASTQVDTASFRRHLELIEEGGYTVRPLADLVAAVRRGETLPSGSVVITIDDAYRSVHEVAWPMLAERDWPFTVFVATDPVDDGLADYMDWGQMREMAGGGLATFANHSASHDHLWICGAGECEGAWRDRVEADIRRARSRLQDELGEAVITDAFAWPYGEYDASLVAMIEAMGYVAFGQQSGAVGVHSPVHALPRFAVAGNYASSDKVALRLASRPLPVTSAAPSDPVRLESDAPAMELTIADSPARLGELACYHGGKGLRVESLGAGDGVRRFRAVGDGDLPRGRSRYNCTAPGAGPEGGTVWYWFSQLWVRPAEAERVCHPPAAPPWRSIDP